MTDERLGTVTFPTGDLVLIDFGLLDLWSGESVPSVDPEGRYGEVAEVAAAAVDLEIVGPNAGDVAARLESGAVHGRFVFDMPDPASIRAKVAAIVGETGWAAEVREIPRMPHLTRTRRLLDDRPDGTTVQYQGIWCVAVRGLPRDRPLEVRGTRMPAGPYDDRWRSVWVQVSDAPVADSVVVGTVMVDEARLMFADPAALDDVSQDTTDGSWDVVFWGRDAEIVATEQAAPVVPGEGFGWLDVQEGRVRGLIAVLERARAQHRFAFDLRPHSDVYRLLAQARARPEGAGTIEAGGALVTGFFTTWGDGAFPVVHDRDADGSLCRVRVELAPPDLDQQEPSAPGSRRRWWGRPRSGR